MFNVSLKMIQVDIFVKITCNNNIIKEKYIYFMILKFLWATNWIVLQQIT